MKHSVCSDLAFLTELILSEIRHFRATKTPAPSEIMANLGY